MKQNRDARNQGMGKHGKRCKEALQGRNMGKRGIHTWISWVLLMTFVIFLGTTIFYWLEDYTDDRITELQTRTETSEKCDFVAIEISEVTQRNAQTLNMKVTNRYNLRINQLVISLFDSSGNSFLVNTTNITLKPNATRYIDVSKNFSVAKVQAIPVIVDTDGDRIFCTSKVFEANVTA